MNEITEFTGTVKFTPKYVKCGPLYIHGHWIKRDIGKPYLVWCNDGPYKYVINANLIEIVYIEK